METSALHVGKEERVGGTPDRDREPGIAHLPALRDLRAGAHGEARVPLRRLQPNNRRMRRADQRAARRGFEASRSNGILPRRRKSSAPRIATFLCRPTSPSARLASSGVTSGRNIQNTKQPELQFRALLTEDGTQHIELARAKDKKNLASRSTVELLTSNEMRSAV